jgi:hypothetical protein
MSCEAIWFEFVFVPALNYTYEHFPEGSSYMEFDFQQLKGFDLFIGDLPELVKIVKRKIDADPESAPFEDTDFYALYDIDVDKSYTDDGHLDTVEPLPTLLGEVDFSKLPLALMDKVQP